MSDPTRFRGRAPRPLAFGTSGLRGLVEDITDLEAWINVRGFLEMLLEEGAVAADDPLFIAGDLRPSTGRIMVAVQRAAQDAGLRPVNLGRIPSPALAAYAFSEGRASAMVTGSHIPFDRNGIKLNRPRGEVLKSDEPSIMAAVERVREAAYAEAAEESIFDDAGALRPSAVPPPLEVDPTGRQFFLRRNLDFFEPGALAGAKIAVYQHSGVGRDLLVEMLEALGAQVVPIGRSEVFVPVDTEAVDEAMLERIRGLAVPARDELGGLDAVVSTDGDADRPLLVVADAQGQLEFVRGDTLGALVAEDLEADAVAVPVSVSDLVDKHLGGRGVAVTRTRIGSPWVVEAMAKMDGWCRVGFEANGGFLVETGVSREGGGELDALPTRDAFLPLLSVLVTSRRGGCSIADRVAKLPSRLTTAGLVDDVPREVALATLAPVWMDGLAEAWTQAGKERFRREGEHPRSADAHMQGELRKTAERIERRFEPYGLGRLLHASWVDGARLHFEGDDVIHLRASGNAPQFRVYATANSMARAEELVELCLRPTGAVTLLLEAARDPGRTLA